MRRTIVRSLTAGTLVLAIAMAGTAVATSPPLLQECSLASNGGQSVNGVCVLPNAIAGGTQEYVESVIATNQEAAGTDTFTLVSGSLPPGLVLPPHHGAVSTIINGVPSQSGTFTFVVQAADPDEGLSSLQAYSITVSAPPDALVCSPGTNGGIFVNGVCVLPGANVGQNYEGFILTSANAGGTFAIVAGSLPPGLFMPAHYGASGTIVAGTPMQQGTFTFTVKGTDQEGQPLRQTYRITVGPPLPIVITLPSPCCIAGTVGAPYDQNLFATGGVQPYTWSIASGQLPPGLGLDCPAPPASFDGVPTTAGTYSFTLRVTDSRGVQTTEPSSITIQPASSPTASLSVAPTCVQGGRSAIGTVRLGGTAPAGGAEVGLLSNNPAVATVPASVTVPAGATSARFLVSTKVVSSDTNVTLIDAYGGQNQFANLSVRVP